MKRDVIEHDVITEAFRETNVRCRKHCKREKKQKKGRKKRDIITEAFREANVCCRKHCKNGGQKEKKMFIGTE